MSSTLIDLSHTVEHGMITYKGLPAPIISAHLSREASKAFYDPGTEFHIGKIEMVANTGTYLDSPFHRYPDGKDLAELELSSLANLEGVVVRCLDSGRDASARQILQASPADLDLRGKAVLFNTVGTLIGELKSITMGVIRSCRLAPPSFWPTPEQRWWESTRSISTIPAPVVVRPTPFSLLPGSLSSSTSAASAISLIQASASSLCQ